MLILNRWAGARPIVGATLAVAQKMGRCKTCPYLSKDEMNPCGCPKTKREILFLFCIYTLKIDNKIILRLCFHQSILILFTFCAAEKQIECKGKSFFVSMDREDGSVLEKLYLFDEKTNPDVILLMSFNEWHEGTEVEPSIELSDKY